MARLTAWRDSWRIVLQLGLFVICCLIAYAVRRLVLADTLSDASALALIGGALLTLALSTVVAFAAAVPTASLSRRIGLRVAPVGLIVVGGVFVEQSRADVSIEVECLIQSGARKGPETVVVVGPGGDDIRLSGDLREGAARRLAALLDAHPAISRIHLTSEGGLADEGQALGDVIAAHDLVTFVPDYCVSACTLAFVRGRERLVMRQARVGFHAPFEEGLFDQAFQEDASAQRAAYIAAGVAPDFVDRALKVASPDLWIPDPEQLIAARVATGVVDRYRFPDSNLDGMATMAGAREVVLRNFPIVRAFETGLPRVADAIVAWYLDAYTLERSEGQVVEGLNAIVDSAVAAAVARADDETLVGVARYLAEAMRVAERTNLGDCVAIGTKGDIVRAAKLLGGTGTRAQAAVLALVGAAVKGVRDPLPEMLEPSPTLVMLRTEPSACADVRRAYAAILRQPPSEAAAAFIRPILAARARESGVKLATIAPTTP